MYIEDLDSLFHSLWWEGLNECLKNEWEGTNGSELCERYGLLQEYDKDLPYYEPRTEQ